MFALNKESRAFIIKKFTTIRNGFANEGLIELQFDESVYSTFNNYCELEKLYFEVIKRRKENRIITLNVCIKSQKELIILNESINWIHA